MSVRFSNLLVYQPRTPETIELANLDHSYPASFEQAPERLFGESLPMSQGSVGVGEQPIMSREPAPAGCPPIGWS